MEDVTHANGSRQGRGGAAGLAAAFGLRGRAAAGDLIRACREYNIRYVFVSLHTNPNVYFNEKPPFTEEEEKRFIQEFLEAVQAERIYCSESEVLYRIPDQAEKPGDGEPKAAGL